MKTSRILIPLTVVLLILAAWFFVRSSQENTNQPTSAKRQKPPSRIQLQGSAPIDVIAPHPPTVPGSVSMHEKRKEAIDWTKLLNESLSGSGTAKANLAELAKSIDIDIVKRTPAISILAKLGDAQSLEVLQDLLLDPERQIRAAAFYALPNTSRPNTLDYTMEPSKETKKLIEDFKNETNGK